MRTIARVRCFVTSLFRRRQTEEDLEDELRYHLDQAIAEGISGGMPPDEARRAAQRLFGCVSAVKEECRDEWGTGFFEALWRDLRYAIRTMQQNPSFTVVAILTLALGIGATAVMFTLVDGVLLTPLPYPHPERLAAVHEWTDKPSQFGNLWAFTYPDFLDCQRESRSVVLAAWGNKGGTVSVAGNAEHVDGFQISSDLFSVLGVSVLRGRAFLPEDDKPGAAPVAIISDRLWQERYGRDPAAVGRTLVFEGSPYTVVGVAPQRFRLAEGGDLYLPLGQSNEPIMRSRFMHTVAVVGRLRPGATLAQAQAELSLIGSHLAHEYPASNKDRNFAAAPLRPDTGDVRSTLWLLLGAVGLILLIACVNVASLLLARAVSREREIAMRVALGAGRYRLVCQCLTESALLGLIAGTLGLLLAAVSLRPFVALWPGTLPRAESVRLDWRVLSFALVSSLVSGLLFGLAPAIFAPVRQLEQALRAGGRTVAGKSRRLHSAFVISEIALAVVLLVSAGMLGRTILRLSSLDPGLDTRNLLIARVGLAPASFANAAQTRAAWKELLDRVSHVPGVDSVAMVDTVPMREGNNQLPYWTASAMPPVNELPLTLATSVTPDYLRVTGIPLREGRFFDDRDRINTEPVVVIDDVLARSAFGQRSAVGKQLWIPNMNPGPVQIIGVAGHVRHWGLAGDDQAQVRAQVYYPFSQVPDPLLRRWSDLMSIAIRTRTEPLSLLESLRRAVRGASGDQVLYDAHTMEQLATASLARQRFLFLLFGVFAGLALLLASVGIYGVLAYLNRQRVPEIGLRMAVGASAANVIGLVLRQSLGMVFAGAAVGLAAAAAAGRILERLVAGVQSIDAVTVVLMLALLLIAALTASVVPARRASRVDPMSALREE